MQTKASRREIRALRDASSNAYAFVVWSYVIGSRECFKGVDWKICYLVWASHASSTVQICLATSRSGQGEKGNHVFSPSRKLNPWPMIKSHESKFRLLIDREWSFLSRKCLSLHP